MKKWWIKAFLQKTFGILPGGFELNYLFQRFVTKGINLNPEYFETRVDIGSRHLKNAMDSFGSLEKKVVLELGTGWHPIVPILFFLGGAEQIITVDLKDHKRVENIRDTLKWFVRYRELNRFEAIAPYIQADRWEQVRSLSSQDASLEMLLKHLHIKSLVCDARTLPLADESVDFIHSNNTFEHIYPQILKPILLEFHRVLKAQGLMSHGIDMTDHFAHMDHSIGDFNFLRFTESQWRRIDNPIQPQSRLRASDYREMLSQTGFSILIDQPKIGRKKQLVATPLAQPWKDYAEEDILQTHLEVLCAKT